MSYRRYDVSDLHLGSPLSEEQEDLIEKLTRKKDFLPAYFDSDTNTIELNGWEEYDDLILFLRKVIHIKKDMYAQLTIVDTDDENDAYWLVEIEGSELRECFGVVVWGSTEDKLKIKNVLMAHLDTTDKVVDPIIEQIIVGLKGGYDDVDEAEPAEEPPTSEGQEPSEKDLTQIEQEETHSPTGAKKASDFVYPD